MKTNSLQQHLRKHAIFAFFLVAQLINPWFVGEAFAMSVRRAPFHGGQPIASVSEHPTWRTLAGCPGKAGTNDGPGVAARFSILGGIVTDSAGNAYVTDSGNHTIRKITPSGIVSTVAGRPGTSGWQDGATTDALFKYPGAPTSDADGNLYVADSGNFVIRKISAAGVVTTIAGRPGLSGYADGSGTDALFGSWSGGLARDANGNLFVADSGNYLVRKVSPDGEVSTFAGQAGTSGFQDGTGTNALFSSSIGGLALDRSGQLYVADSGNFVIRKITPAGVVTTWVGQQGKGAYRDGKGTNAWFLSPVGLAIDRQDNVYVAEGYARLVRKISPQGEVWTLGGDAWANDQPIDGLGPFARFTGPRGMALTPSGHLLVVDSDTLRYASPGTESRTQILRQPCSQVAGLGGNAAFQVTAQCNTPLRYQWLANGQMIVGATNSALVLESPSETNAGEYRVAISDEAGVGYVLSIPASLQVRPAPSGNPLDNWRPIASLSLRDAHGLAYGNGRFVAVGGGYAPAGYDESFWSTPPELRGSVATSTDGGHWVKQFPITSESLNSVAFGNGTFVAVGNNGTIFTSTTGLAWMPQTLTAEGLPSLHGITFDQGLFVAVSGDANGSIWTSTDGCNWTNRGIDFGVSFVAVAAQGGRFIAVGNTIMTSTNGVDWEAANVANVGTNYLGQEITLEHIACGNGTILAAKHEGNGVLVSSNGLEWRDAAPTSGLSIARVTFGNGQFLAVDWDSGGVSVSMDGVNWSSPMLIRCGERSASRPHLCFEQGLFVATGDEGALFTSTDGKSWTFREQQQAFFVVPTTAINLGERYLLVGGGAPGIAISSNGSDWSLSELASSTWCFGGLAYGGGRLVAVGSTSVDPSKGDEWIFTSDDDGATWSDRSPHLKYGTAHPGLGGITYGGGVFVASGSLYDQYSSPSQSAHLLVSSDGVSWTAVNFAGEGWLGPIVYGKDRFVALLHSRYSDTILTSTNGLSWITAATVQGVLNSVAYGNGRFVIGTYGGTVITSTDGKRWNAETVPIVSCFDRIAFGHGLFLASDSSRLWSSPDGVTWTQRAAPPVSSFQTIAPGTGVFFAVGEDAVLYQSGPIEHLGNPCWLSNRSLEWTVTGAPRINYRIEFSEDLIHWQTLTHVTNAPATNPVADPDAATRSNGFYRVVTE